MAGLSSQHDSVVAGMRAALAEAERIAAVSPQQPAPSLGRLSRRCGAQSAAPGP